MKTPCNYIGHITRWFYSNILNPHKIFFHWVYFGWMCFRMLTIKFTFHGLVHSSFMNKVALRCDIVIAITAFIWSFSFFLSEDWKRQCMLVFCCLVYLTLNRDYSFCYSVSFLLFFLFLSKFSLSLLERICCLVSVSVRYWLEIRERMNTGVIF